MKLTCPACASTVNVPEKAGGRVVKCPGCKVPFQVPVAKAAPAPLDVTLVPDRPSRTRSAKPPKEKVYFDNGEVRVTSTRAVLGGKTFAMVNVGSVSVRTTDRDAKLAMQLIIYGAVGTALTCGLLVPVLIVGIILYAVAKPWHVVRIASASGEVDGYVSRSRALVGDVADAISQAIVERG